LEIGADSNSDQVLLQIANTLKLKKKGKEKGGNNFEQAQRNALYIVLLFLFFLFILGPKNTHWLFFTCNWICFSLVGSCAFVAKDSVTIVTSLGKSCW
jgi:hypothetical protein